MPNVQCTARVILDINILESVSHNEILCKLISLDRGKISVSGHVIIRWIRNDFSSEIEIEKNIHV